MYYFVICLFVGVFETSVNCVSHVHHCMYAEFDLHPLSQRILSSIQCLNQRIIPLFNFIILSYMYLLMFLKEL